ncbi:hypothetical protein JCM8547_000627 [Rhodosporidiobolus lusitaniae]
MSESSRPKPPSHLPSLLAHLRTSSSQSTASTSLSLDPAQASTNNTITKPLRPSLGYSPAPSTSSRHRTVSSPHSSTRSQPSTRTPLRSHSSLSDLLDSDDRTLSRTSSSSSLDGLAQRLKGAREGRGRGPVLHDEGDVLGKGKGKEKEQEEEAGKGDDQDASSPTAPLSSSSSPTRSRQSSYTVTVSDSLPRHPTPHDVEADGRPLRAEEDPVEEDEDDEEENDDDSLAFDAPSRFEGQPDPRDMLRAQLARGRFSKPPDPVLSSPKKEQPGGAGEDEKVGSGKKEGDAGRYQQRRYFVLSTAGKLIWTSDQDEEQAAGLVGVMQAIVSIFADEGDKIRYVNAGSTRIAFLLKPPLYLVVVSNGWGEPESVLRSHLDHLHYQVLSVVTLAQLQALFARRSNADLRRLIEGTEPFFHSLTSSLQTSPLALSVLTASIEVYRLAGGVREEVAKAIEVGKEVVKDLDLLYILVIAHGRLVTLLRPKKHSIHPTDLHLLLSTIYSSTPSPAQPPSPAPSPAIAPSPASPAPSSLAASPAPPPSTIPRSRKSPLTSPSSESWFPICLPRFNPRGFLYAYVSFLPSSAAPFSPTPRENDEDEEDGGVGVVVLSSRRDAFEGAKDAANGVKERLLARRGKAAAAGASGGGFGAGALKLVGGGGGRMGKKAAKGADGGLVHEIEMERVAQEYSLGELAIPGLRHFVYKSRALVQITRPAWEGEYKEENGDGRCRLVTLYQTVHEALHPRPAQAGSAAKPPAMVQYVRTEHEAVLGWITPAFELYVCTTPLLPHSAVVSAARAVSKWVQKDEARLFLTSAPSF